MSADIYKEKFREALLFNRPVLYSREYIDRSAVPEGWYCYDLAGSFRRPSAAVKLKDRTHVNFYGTVLSPVPLKRDTTLIRNVNGQFLLLGGTQTLREFCNRENLPYPAENRKFELRPASPEEAGLFYAQTKEQDEALGCIGHVRIDFGSSGRGFHHTWWPRGPEEWNTADFRAELAEVVDSLRMSVLKSLTDMRSYCQDHGGEISGASRQNYGFVVETEQYQYLLRCSPYPGDYQAYLTCFDRQIQEMNQGQQAQPPQQGMTIGGM